MKPQGDQGNAVLSRAWKRKGMKTALLTLTIPLDTFYEAGSNSSLS